MGLRPAGYLGPSAHFRGVVVISLHEVQAGFLDRDDEPVHACEHERNEDERPGTPRRRSRHRSTGRRSRRYARTCGTGSSCPATAPAKRLRAVRRASLAGGGNRDGQTGRREAGLGPRRLVREVRADHLRIPGGGREAMNTPGGLPRLRGIAVHDAWARYDACPDLRAVRFRRPRSHSIVKLLRQRVDTAEDGASVPYVRYRIYGGSRPCPPPHHRRSSGARGLVGAANAAQADCSPSERRYPRFPLPLHATQYDARRVGERLVRTSPMARCRRRCSRSRSPTARGAGSGALPVSPISASG